MDTTKPIDLVLSKLGGQSRLAEMLGKRQSTVAYWVKTTGIPAEAAVALERATNGEIPRWVSRPDLWETPSEAAE
jgi:DNA-binding transcriptional regulator YdaS (Cro superfamily)